MNPIKQSLSDMRGDPSMCDFCEAPKTLEELEPEEAGMWVCRGCQERWEREEAVRGGGEDN